FTYSDEGDVSGLHLSYFTGYYYSDFWVVKFSSVVGIAGLKYSLLNINPTLAHDNVEVNSLNTKNDRTTLDIYSLTGNLVLQSSNSYEPNQVIDISTLPSGVYFAEELSAGGIAVGKFVKY